VIPLVSANGCRTLAKFRKKPLLGSCPHETKHSGRGYEIIIKEIDLYGFNFAKVSAY